MATLALYVTSDEVIERLPPDYSDGGSLTADRITDLIRDASEWMDGSLRGKFIQFNGVGDTPPTPRIIRMIVREKVRVEALNILQVAARNAQLQDEIDYRASWCEKEAKRVLNGDLQLGEEEVTDETLSWGDGTTYTATGWPTYWARLGASGTATAPDVFNLIRSSLRVSSPSSLVNYQNGVDFYAHYEAPLRKWFLVDSSGRLNDQTSKVSYKWNYERVTDTTTPGSRKSGLYELT